MRASSDHGRGARGGRSPATSCTSRALLRAAGLPVGPGRVIEACGRSRPWASATASDFYWTLHAVFVNRRDQRESSTRPSTSSGAIPQLLERMMQPAAAADRAGPARAERRPTSRRLAEALAPEARPRPAPPGSEDEESSSTPSSPSPTDELLQQKDFEQMSADELAQAQRAIAQHAPADHGRADPPLRAERARARASTCARTLRAMRCGAAATLDAARGAARAARHPPLVILCDISGSMSRYSRMLLHFLHALTNDRDRVYTLPLRHAAHQRHRAAAPPRHRRGPRRRSAQAGARTGRAGRASAIACTSSTASGRGGCSGQGAVVLLITDGLDRDAGDGPRPARWSGCTSAAAG